MFSIREAVHDWLRGRSKDWSHDRTATIGASEIGQCARKIYFAKGGTTPDLGEELKGAAARGDLIEQHVWVPALLAYAAKHGAQVHFAGEDQETLVDGYLSATADAIITSLPDDALAHLGVPSCGGTILAECKSIDPRANLTEAKAEHRAQIQTQLGVVRHSGRFVPGAVLLSYIDASFLDTVTEFAAGFDAEVYANAKARALRIMDAGRAIDLRPEGKMAGGRECEHCAWSSRCVAETVAGIPAKADVPLADNAAAALADAVARQQQANGEIAASKAEKAEAEEEIKEILRAHGVRRFDAPTFGVSWSSVKGRKTTDLKAAEQAGIDLTPFTREGDASERLTIKSKD